MKRLMFYMGGHLPLNTLDWPWVDDTTYLEPALKHASLLNNTLTNTQRAKMIASYYKFMIVRNPLERIVSGFRNKIEPPLDRGKQDKFPHMVKKFILTRYRPAEFRLWQGSPTATINVTFQEFVHYLIDVDSDDLNEHFRPSMDICHPCLLHYDFYGNFKNYSHDAAALIEKFKTNPKYYRDESLHTKQGQTFRFLDHYYSQLTHREKFKLLGAWYDELAFYYTLYPSEQPMHRALLGIDLSIS